MQLIQDQRELVQFLARIADSPVVAVDTEFVRETTYRPRLALLQLAAGADRIALVDPCAVPSLAPFFELLRNPGVRKVMHASFQDIEIFVSRGGVAPVNVFDTQVAAAFLGYGPSTGLARLAEAELGIVLDKSQTYTDWMRRPLSEAQLHYAANDVRFLCELAARLEAKLAERGRAAWVAEVQRGLSEISRYTPEARRAYVRVKRAWTLDAAQLSVLRELAAWREEEAERQDRTREAIMPDERLVALAAALPGNERELRQVQALGRNVWDQAKSILDAIARGRAAGPVSDEEAAELRPADPDVQVVIDLVLAVVRERAHAAGVAASYLAAPGEIRRLVETVRRGGAVPAMPFFDSWRREVAGGAIAGLFAGTATIGMPGACVQVMGGTA